MNLRAAVTILFLGCAVLEAQTLSVPPPPADATTNAPADAATATTETNVNPMAVIERLADRLDRMEQTAQQNATAAEAEQLKVQLYEAQLKLDRLQSREEDGRSTLTTVLIVVVALAAVCIISLVAFSFYTMRRLTELSEPIVDAIHTSRHPHALPPASPTHAGMLAAFGQPHDAANPQAVVPRNETRLLDAMDRLERKIEEIERAAHHSNNHIDIPSQPASPPFTSPTEVPTAAPVTPPASSSNQNGSRDRMQVDRFVLLLNKGEAHLNLQQFESALQCFEQASMLAPADPVPYVKRGYALEKLGRLEDALGCYDHALQYDVRNSMAYLLKGGVFNRLQRYVEAIECYDRALELKAS